jgi:hypothetical protein
MACRNDGMETAMDDQTRQELRTVIVAVFDFALILNLPMVLLLLIIAILHVLGFVALH